MCYFCLRSQVTNNIFEMSSNGVELLGVNLGALMGLVSHMIAGLAILGCCMMSITLVRDRVCFTASTMLACDLVLFQ